MLSLVLVLLAVQSAFGASVIVNQVDIDEVPVPVETSSSLVTAYLIESGWELIDEGDANVYTLTIEQIQKDLARSPDRRSQALAVCQLISVVGELASGRVGDACAFAGAINAAAAGVDSPAAVANWLARVNYDIDAIASLAENKLALRTQTGPISNCVGSGRSYSFEGSWDNFLKGLHPASVSLINEEYCATKRLYNAWSIRSNVVGAAVTACANARAVDIFQKALPATANLLRAVATNGNVAGAAAGAKQALLIAAN